MSQPVMSARACAALWGVTTRTITDYCRQGLLPATKLAGPTGAWQIPAHVAHDLHQRNALLRGSPAQRSLPIGWLSTQTTARLIGRPAKWAHAAIKSGSLKARRFPLSRFAAGHVWGIEQAEAERWASRYRPHSRDYDAPAAVAAYWAAEGTQQQIASRFGISRRTLQTAIARQRQAERQKEDAA